ncbi:hypothetical protein EDB92DRAFT_1395872 [Lactarius akahatsu]|uniref:Uncharacterized protein n=1 Tax=Lactarius akahatsu TaxID=416441 RepID=A0AAD4LM69_9AGAM|nr:hypothetical protein EDB92DRAFT_1395872 [Lactarius akahatsu]
MILRVRKPESPVNWRKKVISPVHTWRAPFIGEHALEALELHVIEQKTKSESYGPYCSIVQSSGMGKSRLLDEFSRSNFLIPINLRKPGTEALFDKTRLVVTDMAKSRSERITRFRDFMTDGQTMGSVGEKRRKFYDEIVVTVREAMKMSEATPQLVQGALDELIECLGPRQTGGNAKFPDVFAVFDGAAALTEVRTSSNRSYFIELCSVLHDLGNVSFFAFFLSTTSTISQFAMPKGINNSHKVELRKLKSSLPFSDLGFDHLMHNRKIFDKFKTIDDVTSTECIMYMGRPL